MWQNKGVSRISNYEEKNSRQKRLYTLRKTSDTGPSFSDAASSCLTFSSPLIIACISSAKDFNCICKKKEK